MKLTGTFVWSVTVAVELTNDATSEEQRAALDEAVKHVQVDMDRPILHDCSNPDLVD